ncbi:hypothetical protein SPHINGO391_500051 [Sphingomonas aurantiaca]|uniref:Uncharacterized protein n=1 Tax=Sphingomonas aurantiaca TaxID=185949 RepID=A0A5E8A8B7_9SPHN|nr:hypothetical protein SPHINGO391_500051 [Sphingomonas aurantiaca]
MPNREETQGGEGVVRGSVRRVRLSTGRPVYSRRVEFCGVRDVQGDEAGTKNYFGLGSGKCFFANGNVEADTRCGGRERDPA